MFQHPHEYTLVRLCFYVRLRRISLASQTRAQPSNNARQKVNTNIYPPSSALQAPSPVKGEGWYLNTAERQAKRLARLRVRACPPEENG